MSEHTKGEETDCPKRTSQGICTKSGHDGCKTYEGFDVTKCPLYNAPDKPTILNIPDGMSNEEAVAAIEHWLSLQAKPTKETRKYLKHGPEMRDELNKACSYCGTRKDCYDCTLGDLLAKLEDK